MNFVNGNIVICNADYIVQQVNCKGVMNAGLAKQIRYKYPFVYYDYRQSLNELPFPSSALGEIMISTENNKNIVCMFAQYGYGTDKRYTDYDAFQKCLDQFARYLENVPATKTVAFPFGIGCGLAGGDWNVILSMLENFDSIVKQQVYIVKR